MGETQNQKGKKSWGAKWVLHLILSSPPHPSQGRETHRGGGECFSLLFLFVPIFPPELIGALFLTVFFRFPGNSLGVYVKPFSYIKEKKGAKENDERTQKIIV